MTATQTPLRREPCSTRRRRTSIGDAEAGAESMTEASCRKPSEKLLQRFMQWRQKSTSTPGP
jgi:hypothetical protein